MDNTKKTTSENKTSENIRTGTDNAKKTITENIYREDAVKNEETLKDGYYLSYDAVFKRIFDSLEDTKIVNFIESIFNKKYNGKCNVRKLLTESYDYVQKKMVSDILVMINNDTYHIEIQSNDDDEMAVRVFEYDIRAALQHSKNRDEEDKTIHLKMPHPVVIYLRKTEKTPDVLKINFEMTDLNIPFEFKVPVIFVEDYNAEELVKKSLFPMIPFFPMRFEKVFFSQKHTAEDEKKVKYEIMMMLKELKNAFGNGKLLRTELSEILVSMHNVFGNIIEKTRKKGLIRSESEVEETMNSIDEDVIKFIDFVQIEKLMEQRITKAVTEKVTNEVTAKVTNEVTAKVTNEVTAKVTNEVTAKVTNEVTAKVTNEVTDKNKTELVLDMLENNEPDDKIIKYAKITYEKLENIKAEIKKSKKN